MNQDEAKNVKAWWADPRWRKLFALVAAVVAAIYGINQMSGATYSRTGRPIYSGFDWVLYPALDLAVGYGLGYLISFVVQWLGRYGAALRKVAKELDEGGGS